MVHSDCSCSARKVVHVLAVLLLGGCAVKDVTQNIYDYVHSNVVTSTSIVPVNNSYPFLPNLSVTFMFAPPRDYDWRKITDLYTSGGGNGGGGGGGAADADATWPEFNDYVLRKVSTCLYDADDHAVQLLPQFSTCNENLVEAVARNRSFLRELDRIHDQLRRAMAPNEKLLTRSYDKLYDDQFSVTFDLGREFSRPEVQMQSVHCLGVNLTLAELNLTNVYGSDGILPNRASFQADQTRIPGSLHVSVETTGVTDVAGFQPCDDRAPSDRHAVLVCRIKAVSRVCKCTPLLNRRMVADLEDLEIGHKGRKDHEDRREPLCTSRQYDACLSSEAVRRIHNQCRGRKACVNRNPTYSAQSFDERKTCENALLELVVECFATSYVQMKMQQLTSWNQLLAQIGGNIGLYLGFSILSVCTFIDWCVAVGHRRLAARVVGAESTDVGVRFDQKTAATTDSRFGNVYEKPLSFYAQPSQPPLPPPPTTVSIVSHHIRL